MAIHRRANQIGAESRSNVGFGAAIEIPATLQAALHSRLDRLTPIRQVIQVAALLGRVFDADLLIAVSQRDAAALAAILHRMWIDGTEFNWSKKEIAA